MNSVHPSPHPLPPIREFISLQNAQQTDNNVHHTLYITIITLYDVY